MRIAMTGSHGLVGSALLEFLVGNGHDVLAVVRGPAAKDHAAQNEACWDPMEGLADVSSIEGCDLFVHLAGENIASGRWTNEKKRKIRRSREVATRILCEGLAAMASPPKTILSASAVGYYGNRGDEALDESAAPGKGFLAEVTQGWEAATEPAAASGIRVVSLRFGMILSPAGGALAKLLPPFRLGLGGRVGTGRQYWSWVSLDDVLDGILHLATNASITGPVNMVSPHPVTNREFTKVLGRVLRRPAVLPLPAFAARLALGEMADELLLSSARVEPKRLVESGFAFGHAKLEPALRHLLGR